SVAAKTRPRPARAITASTGGSIGLTGMTGDFMSMPHQTFAAMGHGGERALWVIPSLDLVVAWNDAQIHDHDTSPGNPRTRCNRAAQLLREAVQRHTRVAIRNDHWLLNESVTYAGSKAEGRLMNVRMVNAVFEDTRRLDFLAEANT